MNQEAYKCIVCGQAGPVKIYKDTILIGYHCSGCEAECFIQKVENS